MSSSFSAKIGAEIARLKIWMMQFPMFANCSVRHSPVKCEKNMGFLNNFAATAVRGTLNATYLQPYGSVTELMIDSQNKSLFLILELKGESQPVEIRVPRYELVQRGNETYIELGEIITSRDWLNTLLREHLNEKIIKPRLQKTPLPAMVTMLL
jgi:hypothetical protein